MYSSCMGIIHPGKFRSKEHVLETTAATAGRIDAETKVPVLGHWVAGLEALHLLRRIATLEDGYKKPRPSRKARRS